MKKFSIQEAIKIGWELTKKNLGFLVGVVIIVFLVNLIPNFFSLLFEENTSSAAVVAMVVALVAWVLNLLVSLGMIKISLSVIDNTKKSFADIYNGYPLLLNFFIGSFLYGLIVILGLFLLVVPGIYFAIKYHFYSYFIVDKKLGPIEALKESGKITQGVKINLLLFSIVLGLINILGAIPFGLGLLITVPVTMLAYAHVYRLLSKSSASSPVAEKA